MVLTCKWDKRSSLADATIPTLSSKLVMACALPGISFGEDLRMLQNQLQPLNLLAGDCHFTVAFKGLFDMAARAGMDKRLYTVSQAT